MSCAPACIPRAGPRLGRAALGSTLAGLALVLPLLLPAALLLAQEQKEPPVTMLRYLRHDGKKLIVESEISEQDCGPGSALMARNFHGGERTVLKLPFDKGGKVTKVDVYLENSEGQVRRHAAYGDGPIAIRRGKGVSEIYTFADNPIVTTNPDWSYVLQLVRRHDRDKGGLQRFPGLGVHHSEPPSRLGFTIDRVGEDVVTVKGQKVALDRYRISSPGADHLAWADASRRVYKLMPVGKPADAVVLEGYYDETRDLGN